MKNKRFKSATALVMAAIMSFSSVSVNATEETGVPEAATLSETREVEEVTTSEGVGEKEQSQEEASKQEESSITQDSSQTTESSSATEESSTSEIASQQETTETATSTEEQSGEVTEETTEQTTEETSSDELLNEETVTEETLTDETLLEVLPEEVATFSITPKEITDAPDASPLVITEIVPACPSGKRLTYIELYNNSDATINFGEYNFYYKYPSGGGQVWNTGDFEIEPQRTIVMFLSNYSNQGVDEFNDYYGTNLEEGKDIYKINYSGFHATLERGFAFGRDEDSIIAYADCNVDGADITDKNAKQSVQFAYDGHGYVSNKEEISDATPGEVADWQIPDKVVHYEDNPELDISSIDGPASLSASDDLTVSATVQGNQGLSRACLYYQQAEDLGVKKVELTQDEDSDTVKGSVANSVLWSDEITWYIEATYGDGHSKQNKKRTTTRQSSELTDEEQGPFIITEVVTPPSVSSGEYKGNTQFSYVELYNQTSQTVNFSFYKFFYEYTGTTTADKTWTTSDPTVLVEPGKALVVWLTNNGNTVEDFNKFYGVNLVEGKDITTISYAGFHQNQLRTLKFGRTKDNIFARATFNENNKATIDQSGKYAIQYTYPRTADGNSIIVTTDTAPTPGSVESWQVPKTASEFQGYEGYPEDDGSAPVMTLHDTCPESVDEGKEVFVTFDVSDKMGLIGSKLHYRLDGTGEWDTITTTSYRVSYYYFAKIPADVLFGHNYVEFYIETFNNYRATTSDTYTIKINRLNATDGVRLNKQDGDYIKGVTTITANDGEDNKFTKIAIDEQEVDTIPVLENGAYYAFLATDRDSYFKNAVTAPYGDDKREIIAFIAKWGQDSDAKVIHIDNKYFSYDEEKGCYIVTLTLWAGDSGTAFEDIYIPDENHEDYTVSKLRLLLENGKEYLPVSIGPADDTTSAKTNLSTALNAIHKIGDSAGMCTRLDATFEIPKEEVTAVGYTWDTTSIADGEYTITATSNGLTDSAKVIVDNTEPFINMGIDDQEEVSGTLQIDPEVTDEGGISEVMALLDGEEVTLPYETPVRNMTQGSHSLTVLAEDFAGNTTQKTVVFQVNDINPVIKDVTTTDVTTQKAQLEVTLEDVNTQGAVANFYKGKTLSIENGDITVETGDGNPALAEDLKKQALVATAPSGNLPYQIFTIKTGTLAEDDQVFVNWDGTASYADTYHAIKMYVLNLEKNKWEAIGTPDEEGNMQVSFEAENHIKDGQAVVLIQCREQNSNPGNDFRTKNVAKAQSSDWDGTGRPDNYDFALAWITDTQYYCESWPEHYYHQNQWIVDHADEWKIPYVIHTGDIVDEYDMVGQWKTADKAMKIFDDAGMPYGVLAGNHDVAAGNVIYENYNKYFGAKRFKDMDCYAGTYNDNQGHYDLITENGQDLLLLYMSWDIFTDEIEWMNDVLEKYSDRKAIILLHRYTNVKLSNDSYLDYAGRVLKEQVVAKNSNVIAVLNGHYHGSSFETAAFDDDGDGVKERTVYQICTDYQSAFEGGEEYIKFLYFDIENNKIYVNSYSPMFEDFNYYDTPKYDSYEAGNKGTQIDIFELNVDFDRTEKTLTCNQFSAGVRSAQKITTANITDGTAKVTWNGLSDSTRYTWFVEVTNDLGGLVDSNLVTFVTEQAIINNNTSAEENHSSGSSSSHKSNHSSSTSNSTKNNTTGAPTNGTDVTNIEIPQQPAATTQIADETTALAPSVDGMKKTNSNAEVTQNDGTTIDGTQENQIVETDHTSEQKQEDIVNTEPKQNDMAKNQPEDKTQTTEVTGQNNVAEISTMEVEKHNNMLLMIFSIFGVCAVAGAGFYIWKKKERL